MQKINRNNRSGNVFDDPFLTYIRGYHKAMSAVRNGMELFVEVDSIKSALFPYKSQPSSRRPGYVSYDNDYFTIEYDDPVIKTILEEYFLNKYSRYRDHLYGYGDSLGAFFQMIAYHLLVTGVSFYKVDWDKVKIENLEYEFPSAFLYLRDSTMKVKQKNNKIIEYKQAYSWLTYFKNNRFKDHNGEQAPRKMKFHPESIFFCKYPFNELSPTLKSLKYLKKIKKFWEFGIEQARSGAEPENHLLPVEIARYKIFNVEKRKYDIARSKIRTNYNYLLDANGPKMTEYYDVYTVIRYKKFLNNLRDYLVEEFNKQILKIVAVKNNFKAIPILKYSGFLTNEELENGLNKYKEGTMSFEDLLESIVKKD